MPADSPIDRVLAVFPDAQRKGKDWSAHCPAHDDSNPSLSISVGTNGKVLFKCWSHGCSYKDIAAAKGLSEGDLFPQDLATKARHQGKTTEKPKPKGTGYATPEAAITAVARLVAKDVGADPGPHISWLYTDATGSPTGMVIRWDPPDRKKEIRPIHCENGRWYIGAMPRLRPLYRLPELAAAQMVYITEGEKKTELVRSLGLIATNAAGGANAPGETDWTPLAGKTAVILPDNDASGERCTKQVSEMLAALTPPAEVRIVRLPGLPEKGDIEQWLDAQGDAAEPADLRRQLEALVDASAEDPPAAKTTAGYVWAPVSSSTFFSTDYRPEWLVTGLIPARQPLIIGGPQKSLKTSTAIDLAISLASGTPALGYFAVPQRRKVAIISGESGPFALQSIGRRVCAAKGLDPVSLADRLTWQFRLPQLAVPEQLEVLAEGLRRDRPDVALVEPLYLSLLAGSDARAENLFDMGPLLMRVAQVCEDAGVTPILAHHTGKPAARSLEPLELADLAYSGVAEFARAWLLISRRERYEPGTGQHKLWLVAGGSIGHNGLYAVDVDEGQMDDDFGGRHWQVNVTTGTETRRNLSEEKAKAKQQAQAEKDKADDTAALVALDKLAKDYGGKAPYTQMRDLAGLDTARMTKFLDRNRHLVKECTVMIATNNGARRPCRGICRKAE